MEHSSTNAAVNACRLDRRKQRRPLLQQSLDHGSISLRSYAGSGSLKELAHDSYRKKDLPIPSSSPPRRYATAPHVGVEPRHVERLPFRPIPLLLDHELDAAVLLPALGIVGAVRLRIRRDRLLCAEAFRRKLHAAQA